MQQITEKTREAKCEIKNVRILRNLVLLKANIKVTHRFLDGSKGSDNDLYFKSIEVVGYGEQTHDNFEIGDMVKLRNENALNSNSSFFIKDNKKSMYEVREATISGGAILSKDDKKAFTGFELYDVIEYFIVDENFLIAKVDVPEFTDKEIVKIINGRRLASIQARG